MRREFIPYYLSRAALSTLFALLVMGLSWKALILAIALFALFLIYLHSGWFAVDPSHPLTPLRRDEHGRQIQRIALIAAATVSLLIYVILPQASVVLGITLVGGPLALALGILTYFATQFVLFMRL